jgi:hypothetical protein
MTFRRSNQKPRTKKITRDGTNFSKNSQRIREIELYMGALYEDY